ncbi:HAMP domain-containing histidine kinase [Metabacillus halosaccharovorans]|uniref:histidine kinase n=2 Tax=Metabacillus halosaccharovorans TaxID=930124 RepID=A0ABT3DEF1_9BACI|nr:HAMP domain-containing histidine kinase [Metabacillus halosaccharovorans]
MKLRNKINLYTAFLFILLILLMNTSIFMVFNNMMIEKELEQIKAETEKVSNEVSEGIKQVDPNQLLRAYLPVDGMIHVLSVEGKSVAKIASSSEKTLDNMQGTYFAGEKSEIITFENNQYAFASSPIIWTDGSIVNLQVTKSITTTNEILSVLRIVLVATTIISVIPVLLSTHFLSNLITRPIKRMTETMKDIQESGQFKKIQLEEKSRDELVEMGITFNKMIHLLQTNFKKQEQFVSNASHELKTPLTIIESYADLMKRRGKQRPEVMDESIEAIHSEAVRMRDMIEQLLLLAKHDEKWNIDKKEVNITELVKESSKIFQNAYHRTVEVNTDEVINTVTDSQKLKQLLFIFLDNAKKYSEEKISIYIEKNGERPSIRIADRGIGIPENDLPKIYDRFYRVDKARTRKQGGSGLGLSMAKEIAEALNIHIQVESVEGIGTTVTLTF